MTIKKIYLPLFLTLLGLILPSAISAAPGDLDASFRPAIGVSGISGDRVYLVQPDGKILIGGDFTILNGKIKSYLARLNADGSLDAGFQAELNGPVSRIYLQPDGKILISGYFLEESTLQFARLNADGSRDTNFNTRVRVEVAAVYRPFERRWFDRRNFQHLY